MTYDSIIFEKMIESKIIPSKGVFTITEQMKQEYVSLYSSLKGAGNIKTKSNKSYALKLAGLSLLKLNKKREEKRESSKKVKQKTKSGIVYIISNEAFPGYYKVGMTQNLNQRLKSYQTYDPHRRFKVEHYKVVENARSVESYFLTHYNVSISSGEWVKGDIIKSIFLE